MELSGRQSLGNGLDEMAKEWVIRSTVDEAGARGASSSRTTVTAPTTITRTVYSRTTTTVTAPADFTKTIYARATVTG